jgi:hypothetical protein
MHRTGLHIFLQWLLFNPLIWSISMSRDITTLFDIQLTYRVWSFRIWSYIWLPNGPSINPAYVWVKLYMHMNRLGTATGWDFRLIDYILVYVPLKDISLVWRRHHFRWRAAIFRSGPLSREGSLSFHTYCDTGPRFLPVLSKGPPHSVASYDTYWDLRFHLKVKHPYSVPYLPTKWWSCFVKVSWLGAFVRMSRSFLWHCGWWH